MMRSKFLLLLSGGRKKIKIFILNFISRECVASDVYAKRLGNDQVSERGEEEITAIIEERPKEKP
jgi:hypothetical protein